MDAVYGVQRPGNGVSWRNVTLFLLTICIAVLCLWMLWPFLPALTGAIVIAVVTRRPYNWIVSKVKNTSIAATIGVVLVILSFIVPATFVAERLGQQVLLVAKRLQKGSTEQGLLEFLHRFPAISDAVQFVWGNIRLTSAIEKSSGFVASQLALLLGGSIALLVQLGILLFLLFFLYRDRERMLTFFRSILPLSSGETEDLLTNIYNSILATFLGRFLVASLQGLVAGITFAGLGVSGAFLLGIATACFALAPPFGAFVVWLPIALYLAVTHQWLHAVILVAVGSLIISTLDNFIYPILVGTRVPLHTAAIFLSILGGIWLFGVSGLILGPIVFTVAGSLLATWHERVSPAPIGDVPALPSD